MASTNSACHPVSDHAVIQSVFMKNQVIPRHNSPLHAASTTLASFTWNKAKGNTAVAEFVFPVSALEVSGAVSTLSVVCVQKILLGVKS